MAMMNHHLGYIFMGFSISFLSAYGTQTAINHGTDGIRRPRRPQNVRIASEILILVKTCDVMYWMLCLWNWGPPVFGICSILAV
jgi:hypothetical protein